MDRAATLIRYMMMGAISGAFVAAWFKVAVVALPLLALWVAGLCAIIAMGTIDVTRGIRAVWRRSRASG